MEKTLGLPYMGFYEDLSSYVDGELNPAAAAKFKKKVSESLILQNELKKALATRRMMILGIHRELENKNVDLASKIVNQVYTKCTLTSRIKHLARTLFS